MNRTLLFKSSENNHLPSIQYMPKFNYPRTKGIIPITERLYYSVCVCMCARSGCGLADSALDSNATGPGFASRKARYTLYRASQ